MKRLIPATPRVQMNQIQIHLNILDQGHECEKEDGKKGAGEGEITYIQYHPWPLISRNAPLFRSGIHG
jgi:hypothetical protein